jgi:hypothetical protein
VTLIAGWIHADHSGLGRKRKRDRLIGMQGGRCAICCVDHWWRLQADHDHDTGLLRGMLCPPCNNREARYRRGVDDPGVRWYLANQPAAGLGWMWKLPDWWTPADTSRAVDLGLTAAEYACAYAEFRRPAAGAGFDGGRRHPGMLKAYVPG